MKRLLLTVIFDQSFCVDGCFDEFLSALKVTGKKAAI
jgi:hypothetical protein